MKKKLLAILLLILFIIPINASAAEYKYVGYTLQFKAIKDWLPVIPSEAVKFGPSQSASGNYNSGYIHIHSVKQGANEFHCYCASKAKFAGPETTRDKILENVSDISQIMDSDNHRISAEQVELIKTLLINGYHYDPTNTRTASSMASDRQAVLSTVAMQFILWEIIEHGRTNFSSVEPNALINTANSAYKKFVYPNGGGSNSNNTLYYYYSKIVRDCNEAMNPSNATAFNKSTYSLVWDSANKRYTTTVSGLGKYNSCSSNNANVKVSNSSNKVTITSTKEIKDATITCSYQQGTGTLEQFTFYRFKRTGVCANNGCQDLLFGQGKRIYSKSFKVTSESTVLKIKKVNVENKEVSGARFRLTNRADSSYSVAINGNTANGNFINRSGEYIVSEIGVPAGYEKISDFNIRISAESHRVTDCTSKGTKNGNTTCLNGQVTVTYSDNTIILSIINMTKNFKIKKIDKDGKEVKGATFQIKNSNNQVLKFKTMAGNVFAYDTNGNLTELYNFWNGSYPIALLPEGEYSIVETKVSAPYTLSSSQKENTTKIKINANRELSVYDESQKKYVPAVDASVYIKNYKSVVKILKTGNGKPLEGVKFLLLKDDKSTEIKAKKNDSGEYDYLADQAADGSNVYVTNKDGYIVLNGIPSGKYYFREIQTVEPYVLPEGNAAYTEVNVDVTKNGVTVNGSLSINTVFISNTPSSFNFYKVDEAGNYLTTGKFKLQRYDLDQRKYVDVKLEKVTNDGRYDEKADIFKESKTGKVQFTLTNGIATFIEMKSSSKYRILEIEAPDGYIKQGSSDTAIVNLDEYGNASGLLVLTNQKILKEDGDAKAELIINIQTGQTRVKYILIISGLVLTIGLLIFLQRKKK